MKMPVIIDAGINLIVANNRCKNDYFRADDTKLTVEFADDLFNSNSYVFESSTDAETAAILVKDLLKNLANKKILNFERSHTHKNLRFFDKPRKE